MPIGFTFVINLASIGILATGHASTMAKCLHGKQTDIPLDPHAAQITSTGISLNAWTSSLSHLTNGMSNGALSSAYKIVRRVRAGHAGD